MCRWITYLGPPIFLETLIYEPENSLVRQSLAARRGATTTNGDGSGVGWYGGRNVPGLYRETQPAWSDPNLRSLAHQIESRLFFAHVRASTGTSTSIANCHPFAHRSWMFMHNGQIGGYEKVRRKIDALIDDDVYNARVGTTDSEAFFYLLFSNGLEHDPVAALSKTVGQVLKIMAEAGIEDAFRMTAALSDGQTSYWLRYASFGDPPSLFYAQNGERLMVVSEPLDTDEGNWTQVGASRVLSARLGESPRVAEFAPA